MLNEYKYRSDWLFIYYIDMYLFFVYTMNTVEQCFIVRVYGVHVVIVSYFRFPFDFYAFYGYCKCGNRVSNKSLQSYTYTSTFRLIKKWQYQNKRQSFNIFTTLVASRARHQDSQHRIFVLTNIHTHTRGEIDIHMEHTT